MTGRASRRAVWALVGAVLALSAVLLPPAASMPSRSRHLPAAEHAVASRPFPAAVARSAAPVAGAALAVHRLLGFVAHAPGSPAMPSALVTAALGLLLVTGPAGRSRVSADRRRPRGPPVPGPAPVA